MMFTNHATMSGARTVQRAASASVRLHARNSAKLSSMSSHNQNSLPAAYYRGGTSRAIMLKPSDLPVDKTEWPAIFLKLLGSPDPYGRQLDGLGGAGISSLSKICVVGRSTRDEADVDYTFYAIGIENDEVDDSGNCGNMSSAVGPFAAAESLVEWTGSERTATVTEKSVRIYNTNTNKIIRSSFPVSNGAPVVYGDYTVDGVGGSGAKIKLEFLDPVGAKTGHLLPTGKTVDNFCGVDTTCIDAANPCAFVTSEDLGIDGTILPDDIIASPGLLSRLEDIRQHAAVAMGLCQKLEDTPRAIPKIAMISRPKLHTVLSGRELQPTEVDIIARICSDRQPHRAIPLSGALCTAVAAQIEGSVIQRCLADHRINEESITIGHSSGRTEVSAGKDDKGKIKSAIVYRTARRIMDGVVYY